MNARVLIAAGLLISLTGIAGAQAPAARAVRSAQDISVVNVGGAVGYDPDIGTVQDGIVHDIRATVSADRRYVQLDVGSAEAVIIRIDNFVVVTD